MEPSRPRMHLIAGRIESIDALDAPGDALASVVKRAIPGGPVKDLLSGTWLGHPLHPLLTDAAIAAWGSAVLLDAWGGNASRRAADRLVGSGVIAALPTAVTGMSDWADTSGGARRAGLVHAAANGTALALYATSYLMRRRGRRRRGLALSFAGGAALAAGAWLGGHLSYSRGVGVNQTAFEAIPEGWRPVVEKAALSDGELSRARVDGVELVLLRRGDEVMALANRCTHRGGKLHEGELVDGTTVRCPLHGSQFSLRDGSVERGPAAAPEAAFEARIRGGMVEVRRRSAGSR